MFLYTLLLFNLDQAAGSLDDVSRWRKALDGRVAAIWRQTEDISFTAEVVSEESKQIFAKFEDAINRADIKRFEELAKNLDVNARDYSLHETVLQYAIVLRADIRFIRILLDAGVDVDAVNLEGETALHYAMGFSKGSEVVRELLKAGADVNAANRDGRTVLQYAIDFLRSLEFVEILLDAKADVHAEDIEGRTVLHDLGRYSSDVSIVKRFLKIESIEVDVKDKMGRTPLYESAVTMALSVEVMKAFLNAGADIKVRVRRGPRIEDLISKNNQLTPKEKMTLLTAGIENRCF